jgi:dipeptidyl aminopeptidase/acylaminoacyl peptidase
MRLRSIAAALILVLAPSAAAPQASPDGIAPPTLFRFRAIWGVALSPDGRQVAYTIGGLPPDGSLNSLRGQIHVVDSDGRGDRALTSATHGSGEPRWSPDGTRIAYLEVDSGRAQLWVAPAAGGAPRRLTRSPTGVDNFAWAPDGRSIAFVSADQPDSALVARRKLVHLGSDRPPVSRLWVVSVDSPAVAHALTDAAQSVSGDPSWSPDGTRIAIVCQRDASNMAPITSWVGLVDVSTRAMTRVAFLGSQIFDPLPFSPDGRWIAFTAAVDSASPVSPTAVYIASLDGRERRKVSEAEVYIKAWENDGRGILVTHLAGTTLRPARLSLDGALTELYTGPLVLSQFSSSADRSVAAFAGESLDQPAEVYVASLSEFAPRRVTTINTGVTIPPFGRTEIVRWASYDGFQVEGLLTYPAGYRAGTRVPLLVVAHAGGETFYASYPGSPYDAYGGFGSRGAWPVPVFTSRGYAVLRVNQRGGGITGYGFDASIPYFRPQDRADRDILAGVDLLVRKGIADSTRMAIMGWSNGALVANTLITTTHRFAAASVLGDFPYQALNAGWNPAMPVDFGGQPWEKPETYVKYSPIFALGRVKTPTLIMNGEDDPAVPVTEARMLYGSLTNAGVPVELAIYSGMGHGPNRPAQVVDIANRNLAWFDRYLEPRESHP